MPVTCAVASLGAWDLVGIRTADFVACQVKTPDWPRPEQTACWRLLRVPRIAGNLYIDGATGNGFPRFDYCDAAGRRPK